jgi:hypothetical protein
MDLMAPHAKLQLGSAAVRAERVAGLLPVTARKQRRLSRSGGWR